MQDTECQDRLVIQFFGLPPVASTGQSFQIPVDMSFCGRPCTLQEYIFHMQLPPSSMWWSSERQDICGVCSLSGPGLQQSNSLMAENGLVSNKQLAFTPFLLLLVSRSDVMLNAYLLASCICAHSSYSLHVLLACKFGG